MYVGACVCVFFYYCCRSRLSVVFSSTSRVTHAIYRTHANRKKLPLLPKLNLVNAFWWLMLAQAHRMTEKMYRRKCKKKGKNIEIHKTFCLTTPMIMSLEIFDRIVEKYENVHSKQKKNEMNTSCLLVFSFGQEWPKQYMYITMCRSLPMFGL